MRLERARQYAEALIEQMRPFCERVEIAGSIRREKPEVKDIEIVAIPKYEQMPIEEQVRDLFSSPPRMGAANMLHFWAMKLSTIRWIKPGTSDIVDWQPKPDGKYWRGLVDNEIKLDLFIAQPNNFGIIYLIRTGPASWSQRLVTRKKFGGLMPEGFCVKDGFLWENTDKVLTHEETDVFRVLGIDWISPTQRGG